MRAERGFIEFIAFVKPSPCLHKMFSRFAASPWGAFLAELPPYGCFGSLLSLKATDEGRTLFLFKFLNKAAKLDFLSSPSTPFPYVKKAALPDRSAAFSPPQQ